MVRSVNFMGFFIVSINLFVPMIVWRKDISGFLKSIIIYKVSVDFMFYLEKNL